MMAVCSHPCRAWAAGGGRRAAGGLQPVFDELMMVLSRVVQGDSTALFTAVLTLLGLLVEHHKAYLLRTDAATAAPMPASAVAPCKLDAVVKVVVELVIRHLPVVATALGVKGQAPTTAILRGRGEEGRGRRGGPVPCPQLMDSSKNLGAGIRGRATATPARTPRSDAPAVLLKAIEVLHAVLRAAPLPVVADLAPLYYTIVLGTPPDERGRKAEREGGFLWRPG